MIFFIAIVAGILFLGHAAVYKAIVSIFSISSLASIRIIFLLLFLWFIEAALLVRYFDSWFTKIYYTGSVIWLGFLLYFFLAAIVYGIVFLFMHYAAPGVSVAIVGKVLMIIALLVGHTVSGTQAG